MKEVTYEEWQQNPTPRMMWVWDSSENNKKQLKVIYISKEDITHPVIALAYGDIDSSSYKHCAEIEKQRRMTNKELSRWLREKPTREYKYSTSDYICNAFEYKEYKQDEEVDVDIRIREDDGEWRKPLVKVEELQMKKKQRGEE